MRGEALQIQHSISEWQGFFLNSGIFTPFFLGLVKTRDGGMTFAQPCGLMPAIMASAGNIRDKFAFKALW